jgi:hypothetical protein
MANLRTQVVSLLRPLFTFFFTLLTVVEDNAFFAWAYRLFSTWMPPGANYVIIEGKHFVNHPARDALILMVLLTLLLIAVMLDIIGCFHRCSGLIIAIFDGCCVLVFTTINILCRITDYHGDLARSEFISGRFVLMFMISGTIFLLTEIESYRNSNF